MEGRPTRLSIAPVFEPSALQIVDFTRVHVHLGRTGTGGTAFDTTVTFPPGADSLPLPVTVPVQGSSERFELTMGFVNAQGDTVFKTGPDTVSVTPGVLTRGPLTPPARYTGVGSTADAVSIDPSSTGVFFGGTLVLTARAYDDGVAMPGTPIAWVALDTPRVRIPDPGTGRIVAGISRGTARVVAHLLRTTRDTTVQPRADTALVLVQPLPSGIAVAAGNNQTGTVGGAPATSLAVRVTADDGLGVMGVTVSFAVAPGGGSFLATTNDTGVAAVNVTLGTTPGPQVVTATSPDLPGMSAVFNLTAVAGAPTQLLFMVQPSNVDANLVIAPAVTVRAADAFGNAATGFTGNVTMAIGTNPGGGALSGTNPMAAVAGVATFANLSINSAGTGYTLVASAVGLAGATSAAFAVISTAPTQLVFVQQPSNATAGVAISPAIQVAIRDGNNNTVTSATDNVTLAIGTNPGGGVLSGTLTVTAVSGIATFPGLSLDRSGGYTLTASASALAGATSNGFTITPAAATSLALVSGGNQSAAPSTLLPAPIIVRVADAFGNGVSGQAVAFAIATGGGSLGTPSATTGLTGSASSSWTLGPAAGAQSVTVTATGLTGSPLTVTATAGSPDTTTVTPRLDTLTALNATRTLVAQARDGQGNPFTGSFTWVSRTPAVATVSPAGLVTAVTNGSTYVVATEAGGTMDSAFIVVQQRLATINVTPGTRSIYLTRNFTFTATAVDGLGSAIAGVTTFTWTSTAPAVASVDAAGNVTALGLGSTQIRATSGAIVGVSNVSIITPITRIAVVVDTVGAATTDTFTLTSLGLTRSYRAVAHDTLDAVMTGVSFTWVSTNGSVAVLDLITGTTARATSAANGVTAIQATAQGFTSAPGAFLTVAQVLASIELTPPAATIGITGSVGLVARGKDANNRYISGGSFTFASATPSVATVVATTGVVTGVSLGTSNVTASSGAITSNVSVVTVGAAVPPVISFGRDTLSVGRGSSTSIPILLSTPSATPVTVNLAVADTFAFWSSASVAIPAGATAVNATLNGRNAGTTTVTATDAGAVYAGATAVLAVTATMRLTTTGYAINATDIVSTQVLLSDPSPAGGTYVTFGYGTAGIAAISPDPAFIPAGQLAADIQIRGLAAGSTTITPSAIGVNGTASSFTAYAPVLTISTSTLRLGQGQYEPNVYVYTPTYTNVAVPVTITSSDTNVVTVTPSVTIPGGSYYAYFATTAKAIGTATVTFSAPGWTASGTLTVTSTTPYVGICCGGSLFTTSPLQNVTVYTQDSVRTVHYRTNSLVVRLSSRDTMVMRVLDTLVTIPPSQYYTSAGRVIPGGLGGSTYVVATASGHQPDSTLYTVVGPPLYLSWSANRIGAGQEDYNLYVYTPNNVTAPLVVTLANPDSTILGAPTTVTIPVNLYYAYFTVRGKTPGSVTLNATAPGYAAASASYTVTSPRLIISGGYTINNFAPARAYTVYSADSVGTIHYRTAALAIALSSSDPTVLTTDPSATIAAGLYYTSTPILTPVNLGSARIVATAAGHGADSTTYTIVQPKLNLSFYSYMIGRRQHRNPTDFYVYTPDNRVAPLAVTVTQTNTAVDSLTGRPLTIPTGLYYAYFGFYGLTNGVDTVIATATGYDPDTAFITVTTPKFTNSGLPGSTTTTNPPFGITVYATDSLGSAHYASDTVVVAAVSSDSTVIQPAQPFFRILKDAYYASPTVNVVGPGTASLTFSDSAGTGYGPTTTNAVTVTGPSLTLQNGSPVLGMRQRGSSGAGSSYVYVPNSVASPLVVNLLSTGTRVATVPATVTIPASSYYAYFDVIAQDTVGTIQIQATATGYNATSMNVQVTQPKFVVSTSSQLNTTSAPSVITVYAADANGSAHYTTEDVVVTLVSSALSVAAVDSTTVTIVNGNYYTQAARWSPGQVGTSLLTVSDDRAVYYKYNSGTVSVAVITPSLYFSWGTTYLGIGQYQDYFYAYTPDNQAAPLAVTLAHAGTARTSTFANLTQTPITGLTIPAVSYYQYFRLAGLSAGTDSLIASATSPAHNPDTAYTVVGLGRIDPIGGWPSALAAGDSVALTLYPRDVNQTVHNVLAATTWTLAPNANIEFRSGGASSVAITSVTILAEQQSVTFYLKGVTAGAGSATITHADYQPYSNTVTITP